MLNGYNVVTFLILKFGKTYEIYKKTYIVFQTKWNHSSITTLVLDQLTYLSWSSKQLEYGGWHKKMQGLWVLHSMGISLNILTNLKPQIFSYKNNLLGSEHNSITLFKSIISFSGTNNILHNIPHIQHECEEYST